MNRLGTASVMLLAFAACEAAQLDVRVLDRMGHPASGVVIALHTDRADLAPPAVTAGVIDQKDQRFVPFVLAVRTGTPVTFPNSDSIAHQVYSFSAAKRFELGLYRGRPYPPVVFDKPGIVVLGCNIHDKMIGYVYVTDAVDFGKTDINGRWGSPTLASGEYRVEIWSPLLARDEPKLMQTIRIDDAQTNKIEFRLNRPLRPEPRPQTDSRVRDY